jgi:hypothetical protein
MHTLNGRPAFYEKGQQIFFADNNPIKLAKNLKQIKAEQKATIAWRKKQGYEVCRHNYNWARVEI